MFVELTLGNKCPKEVLFQNSLYYNNRIKLQETGTHQSCKTSYAARSTCPMTAGPEGAAPQGTHLQESSLLGAPQWVSGLHTTRPSPGLAARGPGLGAQGPLLSRPETSCLFHSTRPLMKWGTGCSRKASQKGGFVWSFAFPEWRYFFSLNCNCITLLLFLNLSRKLDSNGKSPYNHQLTQVMSIPF